MSKSVLVVDDEPALATSLAYLMEEAGHGVRVAADGKTALELARQAPPDLILLDVSMPGFSGYEVCRMVKTDPILRRTKVMMLTARARDVEREKGLAMGADSYLTKPFGLEDLDREVARLLGLEGAVP